MLAKGLRTHSLKNCAGYTLCYIKIVYKPRNIPVQVKDDSRLLIKTTVYRKQQCKGNSAPWFVQYVENCLTLYRLSTVNTVCHDAAYDSCGASSCAPHTNQNLPDKPANRARFWLSCRPWYKMMVFLPTESTIRGGCLLLFRLALCYCPRCCSK
jgi:hypothetical protein